MNVLAADAPQLKPVNKVRAGIAAQRRALEDLASAPRTEQELRDAFGADIDRQCERGDLVGAVAAYGRAGAPTDSLPFAKAAMLVALFGREVVIDRLVEIAREVGWDPRQALSKSERDQRARDNSARLSALQVDEERAILKAEADTGQLVSRRPDIDPRVIFDVWNQHAAGGAPTKLRQLVRAADGMHRITLGLSDEYVDCNRKVQAKRAELSKLEVGYQHLREPTFGSDRDAEGYADRQIARVRAELEEAEAAMAEAAEARDQAAAEWQAFVAPVRMLMEHGGDKPGVDLVPEPVRVEIPAQRFTG